MPRRTIDIVFTKAKIAVFMDGCFWHGCPEHATHPRANAEWWRVKLDKNMARDVETTDHLTAQGWTVLRFWEHESTEDVANRIAALVADRSSSTLNVSSAPFGVSNAGKSLETEDAP
jgi:DNA mismatch endonuclease (patch repair protein)